MLAGMVKPPPAGPAVGAVGSAAAAGPFVQQGPPTIFQEGPIGLGGRMGGQYCCAPIAVVICNCVVVWFATKALEV